MAILDRIWRLGAPSNTDPADDGEALTGNAQVLATPSRGIHCTADGTVTVVMSGSRSAELTFVMVKGLVYPYSIKSVVSSSGGFAGVAVR